MDVSYGLMRESVRHARVLTFSGGEEMLGEIVFGMGRCSPGLHVPGDNGSSEHKSEETEGRDGEEDMHVCFKKDNKGASLRAAYSSNAGYLVGLQGICV